MADEWKDYVGAIDLARDRWLRKIELTEQEARLANDAIRWFKYWGFVDEHADSPERIFDEVNRFLGMQFDKIPVWIEWLDELATASVQFGQNGAAFIQAAHSLDLNVVKGIDPPQGKTIDERYRDFERRMNDAAIDGAPAHVALRSALMKLHETSIRRICDDIANLSAQDALAREDDLRQSLNACDAKLCVLQQKWCSTSWTSDISSHTRNEWIQDVPARNLHQLECNDLLALYEAVIRRILQLAGESKIRTADVEQWLSQLWTRAESGYKDDTGEPRVDRKWNLVRSSGTKVIDALLEDVRDRQTLAKGNGARPKGKPKLSTAESRERMTLIQAFHKSKKTKKDFCNWDSAKIKQLNNALAWKRTKSGRANKMLSTAG